MKNTLLWTLRQAFLYKPFLWCSEWILGIILSLFPAMTVLAIQALAQEIERQESPGEIYILIFLVALLIGGSAGLKQIYYIVARLYAFGFSQHIARIFFHSISTRHVANLNSPETAKRIRAGRESITQSMTTSYFQAVENIILATITAVSLAWSLWSLSELAAVLSFLAIIPEILTYMWVGKLEARYWPESSEHMRRATYIEDQLTYQKPLTEIASLGKLKFFLQKSEASREKFRATKALIEKKSLGAYSLNILVTTILIGVSISSIVQQTEGNFGAVAAGLVGVSNGISAIRSVGYQVGELGQSVPAVRAVMSFVEEHNSSPDGSTRFEGSGAGAIEKVDIRDLSVTYAGRSQPSLDSFNATLTPGKIYAIIGKNGAGKSTLINALTQKVESSGVIDIVQSPKDAPVSLATIDQDFGHFELTVREFLTMGTEVTDGEISSALRFSDAEEIVDSLPEGLDSQLGGQWDGQDLSGGQWQRLALARMFLRKASIWLLDEPTSSIDADAEAKFFDSLVTAKDHHILLVVSHRLNTILKADYAFILQGGLVVEQGVPRDLLAQQDSEFFSLFRSQRTL